MTNRVWAEISLTYVAAVCRAFRKNLRQPLGDSLDWYDGRIASDRDEKTQFSPLTLQKWVGKVSVYFGKRAGVLGSLP